MAAKQVNVFVTRWSGGQHPSIGAITRVMQQEGLQPYTWTNSPNHRYAVRSHGYNKVLYVLDGTLELILPDQNQRVILRAGDRADIPAGVRHGVNVGSGGVQCVEAAQRGLVRR